MNKETPKIRLAYLDNVRSLVIILVVAMHSAVTYSGLGGWYYIEGSTRKLSVLGLVFFGLMQSFLQAWTMGMLFFISAYFTTKALAKRGPFKFIKERLFRLGLPLLLYIFIIYPIIRFIIIGYSSSVNSFFKKYIMFLTSFSWAGETGPLWFVQVLLVLCMIYAILKKCFSNVIKIEDITAKNVIFTILITTIIAFLVRLVFPVGTSFYNLQFSFFTSYIVMFIAGIIIGENNLLDKITDEKNIKWLKISLFIGIPLWFIIMLPGGALKSQRYAGGFYWQSFAFALWESLTAIGFSLGLIALFKKKMNVDNKFAGIMRDNAFGIYFFHAPILISISLRLRYWIINPVLKFAVVTLITSLICLFFSFLIRKIKPIGVLFK
jgi:surface polysaccharide O-acyltransferase-like enzyme